MTAVRQRGTTPAAHPEIDEGNVRYVFTEEVRVSRSLGFYIHCMRRGTFNNFFVGVGTVVFVRVAFLRAIASLPPSNCHPIVPGTTYTVMSYVSRTLRSLCNIIPGMYVPPYLIPPQTLAYAGGQYVLVAIYT